MFGKTPVTVVEEFCAKKAFPKPLYTFEESTDGTKFFICYIEALQKMSEGKGRSKKEAKHEAAANVIKKIKLTYPDIENIPQAPHESIPTSDAVADLRDLCIQQDHPLPQFQNIQQAGPPEAPEFTVECSVATIRRYATASTKKGAKQLAAQQIIKIIKAIPSGNTETQIANLEKEMKDTEEQNQRIFKTYREYIESDIKIVPGTRLCDRHNYFKKLDPELKAKAKEAVQCFYSSDKDKVHNLLSALNIRYKTTEIATNAGPGYFIELLGEFDVVFAGCHGNIYRKMLEYFEDML